jgi:ADP-ribose pyrophosphatase
LEHKPWKTLTSRKVVQFGKWLEVENHTVELSDGRQIPDWAWLITPDYINVLAVTVEGQFLCFRQIKYAIKEGTTLSIVGGYIEPGEDPLTAARRELREEMGYIAPEWTFLGKYVVDSNRGVGTGYFYLAQQAEFAGKTESDDLEPLEMLYFSRSEIQAALKAGEFKSLSWAATIALALQYL